MNNERRTRTRVTVTFDVSITTDAGDAAVRTWDISLRGMKCSPHPLLQEGTACRATFTLSQAVSFSISGKVVRTTARETAVFFTSMEENSFFHLKRLVQFNTDNPDQIDHELATNCEKPH